MPVSKKVPGPEIFEQDTDPEPDYKSMMPGALQEIIDQMWDERPKDKRSKVYKQHVKKLNQIIDIYNSKAEGKYIHAS